jgi:hypothetical protein
MVAPGSRKEHRPPTNPFVMLYGSSRCLLAHCSRFVKFALKPVVLHFTTDVWCKFLVLPPAPPLRPIIVHMSTPPHLQFVHLIPVAISDIAHQEQHLLVGLGMPCGACCISNSRSCSVSSPLLRAPSPCISSSPQPVLGLWHRPPSRRRVFEVGPHLQLVYMCHHLRAPCGATK